MSASSHHTAKTIVFTCMDERLETYISSLIQSFEGGAFHAAMAGGGAAFAAESDSAVALKQVLAAYKINHITDVYLQSHHDCGAYGLSGVVFHSRQEETSRLYADLDLATDMIKAALAESGEGSVELTIHTEVINLAGEKIERPLLAHVG